MPSRRNLLTGIGGIATTTALAGCNGDASENEEQEPEPGADETDTDGPEDATTRFFEALIQGDAEAANENYHPESDPYPIDDPEEFLGGQFSLAGITELSVRELAEWRAENSFSAADEEQVQEEVDRIGEIREQTRDRLGISEIAHVLITAERVEDGEIVDSPVDVVRDDGAWLVYITQSEPEPAPEPEQEEKTDEETGEEETAQEADPESRALRFLENMYANGFDGELADMSGRNRISIAVGSGPNGFQFDPAGVVVDVGTTVVWEWTGEGGGHNVVSEADSDFEFQSERTDAEGFIFEQTFSEEGAALYVCVPHRAQGKYGAIVVAD